jgi:hypothetical protein
MISTKKSLTPISQSDQNAKNKQLELAITDSRQYRISRVFADSPEICTIITSLLVGFDTTPIPLRKNPSKITPAELASLYVLLDANMKASVAKETKKLKIGQRVASPLEIISREKTLVKIREILNFTKMADETLVQWRAFLKKANNIDLGYHIMLYVALLAHV